LSCAEEDVLEHKGDARGRIKLLTSPAPAASRTQPSALAATELVNAVLAQITSGHRPCP